MPLTPYSQIIAMRDRLASLGFAMALDPIPVFDGPLPFEENDESDRDDDGDVPMEPRNTTSSHTVGRSAPNLGHGAMIEEEASFSPQKRPHKRSRMESPAQVKNIHAAPSSRDMMPPPPGPLSKMKSIKKMIPNLRQKLSSGGPTATTTHKPADDPDTQMDDSGGWTADNTIYEQPGDINTRPPTRHGPQTHNGSFTSGVPGAENNLPTNASAQQPGLLPGLGVHNNESAFTFEAPSRLRMPAQQPGGISTDHSYMNLLDNLGHHTGLDLGLEDPRDRNDNHHPKQQVHPAQLRREKQQKFRGTVPKFQTRDPQREWNDGHGFLEQSLISANPTSALLHTGPHYARDGDVVTKPRQDNPFINPTTPVRSRFNRPMDEEDRVVSPFFGSGSHHLQSLSRPQFAEPDVSSIRSATSQFRHNKPSTDTDWREPRSLNGLSFFDSPVNKMNERIELRREPEPQYTSPFLQDRGRSINSQGFFTRTDAEHLPMHHDNTNPSLDRSYSRETKPQSRSVISFPSFNRFSFSRNSSTRLPSAMPPTIPGHSPSRQRTGAGSLENFGVKSSQRSRLSNFANSFARSGKSAYSSASRRVVRR